MERINLVNLSNSTFVSVTINQNGSTPLFSFYANIQFGKIGLNKRPPLLLAGSINEHFYVVYLVIVVAASTMEITLHIYSIENTV